MSKYAVMSSLVLLLLYFESIQILAASSISSSITSTSTHHQSNYNEPFNTKTITNFLGNRCGITNPALWSYEGKLTDPASGKVIAEVEGLEIVKALPVIYPSPPSATTTNNNINKESIFNKLYANRILYPQTTTQSNNNQQWDSAVTILSRKIFCYRNPRSIDNKSSIETNKSSLLTSVRLRPDGPIRHLSPEESISMYDSAVTYISRNNGKEMIVFSERPDIDNEECIKNYVMGTAKQQHSSSTTGQSTVFDFAIHGQKGISDTPMLPPLKQLIDSEEVVISPPRSRLFQFGKGDGSTSSDRKYGSVRETYTYTFDHNDYSLEGGESATSRDIDMKNVNRRRGFGRRRRRFKPSFSTRMNQIGLIKKQIKASKAVGDETLQQPEQPKKCSVRYTRYGEAPPWYAPGRSCTLELQGKRINDDSTNAPTLASWVATKCNFWSSGWPAIFKSNESEGTDLTRQYYQLPKSSESELAQRAVELFCTRGEQPIIKPLVDDWPVVDKIRWISSVENGLSSVQSSISRLSKSFVVSEIPNASKR